MIFLKNKLKKYKKVFLFLFFILIFTISIKLISYPILNQQTYVKSQYKIFKFHQPTLSYLEERVLNKVSNKQEMLLENGSNVELGNGNPKVQFASIVNLVLFQDYLQMPETDQDDITYIEQVELDEVEEQDENLSQVNTEAVQKEMQNKPTALMNQSKWRIVIPRIGLNAPITSGTNSANIKWFVGHFKETDPWNGNVALAAHNRGSYETYFARLKDLQKGDMIEYYRNGNKRVYQVTQNTIIKETDLSCIENTNHNELTLITCVTNQYENRRCVKAKEIK